MRATTAKTAVRATRRIVYSPICLLVSAMP
jgi:hypothetical protein